MWGLKDFRWKQLGIEGKRDSKCQDFPEFGTYSSIVLSESVKTERGVSFPAQNWDGPLLTALFRDGSQFGDRWNALHLGGGTWSHPSPTQRGDNLISMTAMRSRVQGSSQGFRSPARFSFTVGSPMESPCMRKVTRQHSWRSVLWLSSRPQTTLKAILSFL